MRKSAAIKERSSATFILQIMFRQNATWQGTIKWVEKQETLHFRSALELIKIIDSANAEGYQVNVVSNGTETREYVSL